jgi:hypothetical protein
MPPYWNLLGHKKRQACQTGDPKNIVVDGEHKQKPFPRRV